LELCLKKTLNKEGEELCAEILRDAQSFLGEITRPQSSDDLLGEIFSRFCIGK
jgi:tRNA modification GTPase